MRKENYLRPAVKVMRMNLESAIAAGSPPSPSINPGETPGGLTPAKGNTSWYDEGAKSGGSVWDDEE